MEQITDSPSLVHDRPRISFLSLPPEIRLRIYRTILPSRARIRFCNGRASWDDGTSTQPALPLTTTLFRANRLVSEEAQAVLYGENEFLLQIDGHQRWSIFGKLGTRAAVGVLRRLRRVELTLRLTSGDSWASRRHRTRLRAFAKATAGRGARPALRQLTIIYIAKVPLIRGCCLYGFRTYPELRWQYPLEELTILSGVERARFNGVDDWFARCLEKAVTGTGGEPEEARYPYVEVMRKKDGGGRRIKTRQSTRRWYMPKYDWDEFAEKNRIERTGSDTPR